MLLATPAKHILSAPRHTVKRGIRNTSFARFSLCYQAIVSPPIYFGRKIPYHERVFESFLEAIRALPSFP
jgi:hypothetical protein